ncbi:trehalose synthase [Arthrobacter sp. RIT-PI-e]|uniref:alpha-amylase family protein n=1 Tax=Arthrobacter sp. RIT-PI-e TaxID=1681197 RepID=UPI0006761423|nr:alpha-amylase family protein [Arthrobacter sp. RIT-PI-e]KNC18382.1 trehalose synthase [Arthrobacter sp. RIT-PI-e]
MRITDTSDLWWKTAVFYNLNVETFLDWDDDGVGDLEGLGQRLDYLEELGVTCIWLAPFYPSPRKDNGYDIADYFGVNERNGHLGDFVEMVRTAHDRGMRVIIDLVVNHTSVDHPWFRQARSSRDNRYRDFYVWRDEKPEDGRASMFPDVEDGVWFHDEEAGQYYEHSFYRHQPDLNTANPAVREEIAKVIGFWLQLGIDGFRVDAVPFLIEAEGRNEHEYLRALRGYVGRRSGTGMMLGEVNLPYEEQKAFFGEQGNELTMQFDFVANQHMYLALARHDATPLAEVLAERPGITAVNQWANFVRNHDELTLDQLTDQERGEVFEAFAPEESMQIHGRGIIRRLPPMLANDPRSIRMVYSLVFSLPGAPVLYYGEEIGMAENASVPGRSAVRTPMQWSPEVNGGFSAADASKLPLPVVEGGASPEHVSVAAQQHDPGSLLHFMRQLIAAYKKSPEIGWGTFTILEQEHPCVFAHTMVSSMGQLVALHNFAVDARSVSVTLPEGEEITHVIDLLGDEQVECRDGKLEIGLEGYGYRWLRIIRAGEKRLL